MSGLGKNEFWQNSGEDHPKEALGHAESGKAARKNLAKRKQLMRQRRRRRETRAWKGLR